LLEKTRGKNSALVEVFMPAQKILCTTDLSRDSKDGVRYSISLARRNGAELIVFHAARFPFPAAYPCEGDLLYQVNLAQQYRVEHLLRDADSRVSRFLHSCVANEIRNVSWKVRVAIGKVAEEIVTAAWQEEVDLIIMTKTKRVWLPQFSRSISAAVRRKAPCPVISGDGSQMIISLPWQGRKIRFIRAILGYGL
jgi:nucleotide-binding universal stress UspA family protein